MTKKIKKSLMLKIFLIVSALLVLISAFTYAAVARFLPVTYANRLKEDLDEASQELVQRIEGFSAIGEAGNLIRLFEAGAKASVLIRDADGTLVWPPAGENAVMEGEVYQVQYSDGGIRYTYKTPMEAEVSITDTVQEQDQPEAEHSVTVNVLETDSAKGQNNAAGELVGTAYLWYENVGNENSGIAVKQYALTVNREPYTMLVYGGMQPLNQAVEVLKEIFPCILALVVAAALLIAVCASRYLTRLKTEIETERELERQRLDFFSAVSHELKTPVTILEGHLQGMLDGVDGYQNRDYYLQRSLHTVQNMRNMVGELLTVARIEGKPPALQQTDLAELLRLQLAEVTELIEQKGLELAAEIPEHCFWRASPPMMEKMFRNLLMNAVRYTPEHAAEQIRIRMESDGAGGSLDFCIENTGAHIAEESLPHLFEAFYRVEQSRSRDTGGSGLGLYIVRMILEQHGARYRIENTADGVAFSFHLQQAP